MTEDNEKTIRINELEKFLAFLKTTEEHAEFDAVASTTFDFESGQLVPDPDEVQTIRSYNLGQLTNTKFIIQTVENRIKSLQMVKD